MSMLTYLVEAEIRDNVRTLVGKTLSRPQLLLTDGVNLTYAVDVDIGEKDRLLNIPLAANNLELRYAEVGSAVTLTRSATGRWEVTGFAKRMPGTYTRVPVQVPECGYGIPHYTIGTPFTLGWSIRAIPYGDFVEYGGYGVIPYGAVAVYQGDDLREIR